MDDQDRTGETPAAADALRPRRPGGERKATAETDQRPDPANAIPRASDPGGTAATGKSCGRASGMIDDPVGAAGDLDGNDDQAATL